MKSEGLLIVRIVVSTNINKLFYISPFNFLYTNLKIYQLFTWMNVHYENILFLGDISDF